MFLKMRKDYGLPYNQLAEFLEFQGLKCCEYVVLYAVRTRHGLVLSEEVNFVQPDEVHGVFFIRLADAQANIQTKDHFKLMLQDIIQHAKKMLLEEFELLKLKENWYTI